MRIAIQATLGITIGLFAFLAFTLQPAEAASMTFTTDETITTNQTIGAGETWTINPGVTVTIASGVSVTNFNGEIINNGTINNAGTITNHDTFASNGIVNNTGTISNGDILFNDGAILNNGTIDNPGAIVNDGTINSTGTINIGAIIHNRDTINNFGTINIFGFSTLWNDHGTINNYGEINNHDSLFNDGGVINNSGTITNICTDSPGGNLNGNPINTEPCFFNLDLFEENDPSDLVFDLGQEARAVAETNRLFVTAVTFKWIDPSGNVDATTTVPAPFNTTRQAEDTFTPDEVGTWTVVADFGDEEIEMTLHVDFMVIPESPMGGIALILSSIAALSAFAVIKRRQVRK